MQTYTKQLLNWRKTNPVIAKGDTRHFAPSNGVYVYFRYNDAQKVMVVMNKSTDAKSLEMTRYKEMLDGHKTVKNALTGQTQSLSQPLLVPAMSAVIWEVK